MQKILKKLKSKYLSGSDLLKLVNYKASIISYPEIKNYENLDELLGENQAIILLYETEPRVGHWITIFKTPKNTIEFFDPYGYFPDDELEFIPKNFRNISNQNKRYLTKLLYDSKYPIEYNNYELQQDKDDIATCGRHVAMRLLFREIPLKNYIKIMKGVKKFSPDDIVTLLTGDIK